MAIDFWKGPHGTEDSPRSGTWLVAANWSAGVPSRTVDAELSPGDYSVTLTDALAETKSLSIGTGASLFVTAKRATAALALYGDSMNEGSLYIAGAQVGVASGSSFSNFGLISLTDGDGHSGQLGGLGGALINEGTITVGGDGMISDTFHNDATGRVSASGPGVLILAGTTTNDGLIEAAYGATVTTNGPGGAGAVTNLVGTTLSGGNWAAIGSGSTLQLAGATIDTLGAGTTVTLNGGNFRIDDGSAGPVFLEQTLNLVESGAALILNNRDWATTEALTVRGALTVDGERVHLSAASLKVDGGGVFSINGYGNHVSAASLKVEEGGVLSGWGTIDAPSIIDGMLRIKPGQILEFTTDTEFNANVVGPGRIELSGGRGTFNTHKVTVKGLIFDGADVEFNHSLSYAGKLSLTAGTIELHDNNLTLTGTVEIATAGIHGGPGSFLALAGSVSTNGATEIDVRAIRVDGLLEVDGGLLSISGTVWGEGDFEVHHGTLAFKDGGRLTDGPLVTLEGRSTTLAFETLDSNGARVASFDAGDRIDFGALNSTGAKASWRADADGQGGTLKISNGSQTATIHLEENHGKKDFALKGDGHGGTIVTLAKTAAFGLVDASAFGHDAPPVGHLFTPAHEWHGALA